MSSELRRRIWLEKIPELAYRIEISFEDKQRIEEIKDFLIELPDVSFVVYFNHISYSDPLYAAYLMGKIDRHQSRQWMAPASYSHTDRENVRSKEFIFMINEAERCGFDISRVVQSYQVDNPEFGYSRELASSTYKAWLRKMKNLKEICIPMGLLISPEGHRSDDGQLMEAQYGVLAAGKIMAPVLYIPLGISYSGDYNRDGVNLLKRVRLSIGQPFFQRGRHDGPDLNGLMGRLADVLPEEMIRKEDA